MKSVFLLFLFIPSAEAAFMDIGIDKYAAPHSIGLESEWSATDHSLGFVIDMKERIDTIQREVKRLSPELIGNRFDNAAEMNRAIQEVQGNALRAEQALHAIARAEDVQQARKDFDGSMQSLELSYAKARELGGDAGILLAE